MNILTINITTNVETNACLRKKKEPNTTHQRQEFITSKLYLIFIYVKNETQ